MKAYTNATYIVKEGYGFDDGLFTGYDEAKRDYDRSTWDYEIGDDGYRQGRRDDGEPALRLAADEGALRALHARDWSSTSAAPRRTSSSRSRADRGDARAGQGDDDHVRARLDAALEGLAEHPHAAMVQLLLGNIGIAAAA